MFIITDDSGFMGIIEPSRYTAFVNEDWELEQLFNHFDDQMKKKNMLIWSTGECNTWKVETNDCFTKTEGYKETISSIHVDTGKLYLVNYESLTMGAQFSDISLPEPHMNNLVIILANGNYNVKIIQFYDPDSSKYVGRNDIDFLIEFEKSKSILIEKGYEE